VVENQIRKSDILKQMDLKEMLRFVGYALPTVFTWETTSVGALWFSTKGQLPITEQLLEIDLIINLLMFTGVWKIKDRRLVREYVHTVIETLKDHGIILEW